MSRTAFLVTSALAVAALGLQVPAAHGKHSWSNYHWERTTDRVPFVLGHNLAPQWDVPEGNTFLTQAKINWTTEKEINITGIVDDDGLGSYNISDADKCEIPNDPIGDVDGVIDVCSKGYGFNGWLGIAQIWVSDGHIYEGVAKLNDTYFNSSTYDKPSWRDFVMCQEVGHVFGLSHQDESFYNPEKVDAGGTKTCMDYTSRPEDNGQPNQHDYDQIALIYNHNDDSPDPVVDSGPGNGKGGGPKKARGSGPGKLVSVNGFEFATYVRNDPTDWGTAVAFTDKGQPRVFVKDLDNGVTVVTHVTWTEDARAGAHFPHH